jgi:hypothetical protein
MMHIALIIYGFTSRSRIFHLYGDVTIAGEGLQNLGLAEKISTYVGFFYDDKICFHI